MTRAVRLAALAAAFGMVARSAPAEQPDAPEPSEAQGSALASAAQPARVSSPDDAAPSVDLIAQALAPVPGGLGPEQAAARATASSPLVAAKLAELRAATAKVEQALAAYFPTVQLSASYLRLSKVENKLSVDLPAALGGSSAFEFPSIVDSYSLSASLAVPVSDYLLRLTQAYAAVSLDVDAKKLEVEAKRLDAAADAKIAYYGWVRAKGQAAVTELALQLTNTHLEDARIALGAGLVSAADVARLEAQRAEMTHLVQASAGYVGLAEEQLRTIIHAPAGEPLAVGADVLGPLPPPRSRDLGALKRGAIARRVELESLRVTEQSLAESASVVRAGYYPRVDAFAEALYANPNQRVFPQDQKWDFTWDLGVRLSWTVNAAFSTRGQDRQMRASLAAVKEQRRALEDGIAMAVTQAYFDSQTARSAIAAADERERAAQVTLDARRQLLLGGKATATDIVDAEGEITRARLQRIDARVGLLVAEVRLAHAIGLP